MNNDARYNVEINRLRKRLAELEAIVAKLRDTVYTMFHDAECDMEDTDAMEFAHAEGRASAFCDVLIFMGYDTPEAAREAAEKGGDDV